MTTIANEPRHDVFAWNAASALLGFLARNYLVLIAAGIAAITIALGSLAVLPKRYTSTVYFRFDEPTSRSANALMSATPIVDKVLAKVAIAGNTVEERRRALDRKRQLTVAPNEIAHTSGLFRMDVSDEGRERARELNQAFIDAWLEATQPPPDRMVIIKAGLARIDQELKWTRTSIDAATREASPLSGSARAMAPLLTKYEELAGAQDKLQRELQGNSRDVILDPPTLPEEPSWPSQLLIMTIAVVAAEILAVIVLLALRRR
jgi:hypothetical protein